MYDVRCHWPLNRCLITEQQAIKILVLLKEDILVFLQILYSLLLICYSRKNHLFGFLDIQCSFLPVIFQARIISVTQLIVILSTSNINIYFSIWWPHNVSLSKTHYVPIKRIVLSVKEVIRWVVKCNKPKIKHIPKFYFRN